MTNRFIFLIMGLFLVLFVLFMACGNNGVESTKIKSNNLNVNDSKSGDFIFHTVTSPEGIKYRCIFVYVGSAGQGGPAIWCERFTQ